MDLHHADEHYKKLEDQFHIRVVSPGVAREALSNYVRYADSEHPSVQHLAFVGDAGVGKTALVRAAAEEHGLALLVLRLAEMSDGEVMGFPFQVEGRPGVVRMCLVENYSSQIDEAEKSGKRLLVFFDEVNRAKASHRNALFNLLDTKIWAGRKLPSDTLFVAAMNPPGDAYAVADLDMALMRRFIMLGIKPSSTECVDYLRKSDGCDSSIPDFLSDHPEQLLGLAHLTAGKKFNCPASFEATGRMIAKARASGLSLHDATEKLSDLIVGAGNSHVGETLITYLRKKHHTIAPSQIITSYRQMRDQFLALEEAQATIVVHQVAKILAESREEIEEDSDKAMNLAMFLADLSEGLVKIFSDMFTGTLGNSGVEYSRSLLRTLRTGEKTAEHYFRAMTTMKAVAENNSYVTTNN